MKPTTLAPGALAVAAVLATATVTNARSANANASAGPTGQATAQTQSVNVVNTPGVIVTNVPTVTIGAPVTVEETPIQPFYPTVYPSITDGSSSSPSKSVFMPAGERFHIQTISTDCRFGTPTKVLIKITKGVVGGEIPLLNLMAEPKTEERRVGKECRSR